MSSQPHNALIVDDEPDARTLIRELTKNYCPTITIIGEAKGVASGIDAIQRHTPDLVFLDIQMGDGSGFDLLEKIDDINFQLIFTTSFDQYAVKAFDYCALDYLLKPIDPSRFVNSIHKLNNNDQASRIDLLKTYTPSSNPPIEYTRLALSSFDKVEFIELDHIIYLEADKNYSTFQLHENGQRISSKAIGEYNKILPEKDFFRTHASFLVNRKYVTAYQKTDGGSVVMKNGTQLPIARRRRTAFLEWLAAGDVLF